MKPSELLSKHKSDKVSHHNYAATYDRILPPYRESSTNILEIGVLEGCSLRAWREYFMFAHIWGIDNDPSRLLDDNRITSIHCDVTERDRFIKVCRQLPMMDVIIDDGSHVADQQVWAVCVLWPQLKPGGLYVVEDIAKREYLDLFQAFQCVELLDLRTGGCQDDIMAIMRKA